MSCREIGCLPRCLFAGCCSKPWVEDERTCLSPQADRQGAANCRATRCGACAESEGISSPCKRPNTWILCPLCPLSTLQRRCRTVAVSFSPILHFLQHLQVVSGPLAGKSYHFSWSRRGSISIISPKAGQNDLATVAATLQLHPSSNREGSNRASGNVSILLPTHWALIVPSFPNPRPPLIFKAATIT